MKRASEDDDKKKVSLNPFCLIPIEVRQRILVEAHYGVSHLNTVCQEWATLLDTYQDWVGQVCLNFVRHEVQMDEFYPDTTPVVKYIVQTALESLRYDRERRSFAQYLARLVDCKLKKLLINPVTDFELSIVSFVTLNSIDAYLKEHLPNILTLKHYHPRDIYLNFTDVGHLYALVQPCIDPNNSGNSYAMTYHTVKPDDNEANVRPVYDTVRFLSVTTFIHSLFPVFDEEAVITRMMANERKWNSPVENAYYGMSRDEIKLQWEVIRTMASVEGTAMHANLEMYYSRRRYQSDSKEFSLFQAYEKDHVVGKLRPYRTEWTIYSVPLQLCGSVDILYEYVDQVDHGDGKKHLVMADWKRSKKINLYNSYQSGAISCTACAGDCNYVHYSIQLSLYKYILEQYYDVVIDAMYLVVLHPNQDRYIRMAVESSLMRNMFDAIIQHRLATIATQ